MKRTIIYFGYDPEKTKYVVVQELGDEQSAQVEHEFDTVAALDSWLEDLPISQ